MTGSSALERFLRTDPRDVGCDQAPEILHVYAELVAADASAAGRFPGVAAHLDACGPSGADSQVAPGSRHRVIASGHAPPGPVTRSVPAASRRRAGNKPVPVSGRDDPPDSVAGWSSSGKCLSDWYGQYPCQALL